MKDAVIIVSARTDDIANKIKMVLEQELFAVTQVCASGAETIRKCRIYKPDLLITDYELGDMTAIQVAEVMLNNKIGSVLILANDMQKGYAEGMFEYPYLICLRKPLNKAVLISSIEISLKSRKGIKNLENKIIKLKEDIETRKIVEKAKGLMVIKLNITEEQAYAKLRKQSMDSQLPMRAVANVIISTLG